MIVVDTNVVVHRVLGGTRMSAARAVFARDREWSAPLLWRSEFRNVLSLYLRKGLLDLAAALTALELAQALLAGREYDVASPRVLALAQHSNCTACDCEFVSLAQDLGVPLVTTDTQVLKAFPSITVSMEACAAL